jgi:hypothetical protein
MSTTAHSFSAHAETFGGSSAVGANPSIARLQHLLDVVLRAEVETAWKARDRLATRVSDCVQLRRLLTRDLPALVLGEGETARIKRCHAAEGAAGCTPAAPTRAAVAAPAGATVEVPVNFSTPGARVGAGVKPAPPAAANPPAPSFEQRLSSRTERERAAVAAGLGVPAPAPDPIGYVAPADAAVAGVLPSFELMHDLGCRIYATATAVDPRVVHVNIGCGVVVAYTVEEALAQVAVMERTLRRECDDATAKVLKLKFRQRLVTEAIMRLQDQQVAAATAKRRV